MATGNATGTNSGYSTNPYSQNNSSYPNSYSYSGTNGMRSNSYSNNNNYSNSYRSTNNNSYPNSYNYSASSDYSNNRGYTGVRAPATNNTNSYTTVASNRSANLNCMAVIEMNSVAKVESAVSAIRGCLGSSAGVIKTNGRFIMFALTSNPTRVEMTYDKFCKA